MIHKNHFLFNFRVHCANTLKSVKTSLSWKNNASAKLFFITRSGDNTVTK